jgi:hypothetical protein
MNIVYTHYAQNTIKDREIDKQKILQTIFEYDEIVRGKEGRLIAQKLFENKLLRVIFEVHKKTYIVITAYYTNPERYMKKWK